MYTINQYIQERMIYCSVGSRPRDKGTNIGRIFILYYQVYILQNVAGNTLGGLRSFLIVLAQLQVTRMNAFPVIYLLTL